MSAEANRPSGTTHTQAGPPASTTGPAIVAAPTDASLPKNLQTGSKAAQLRDFLAPGAESAYVPATRKLVVEIVPGGVAGVSDVKVTFEGPWDGRLLKGAIRQIEHKYKMIKHEMTQKLAAERSAQLQAAAKK